MRQTKRYLKPLEILL